MRRAVACSRSARRWCPARWWFPRDHRGRLRLTASRARRAHRRRTNVESLHGRRERLVDEGLRGRDEGQCVAALTSRRWDQSLQLCEVFPLDDGVLEADQLRLLHRVDRGEEHRKAERDDCCRRRCNPEVSAGSDRRCLSGEAGDRAARRGVRAVPLDSSRALRRTHAPARQSQAPPRRTTPQAHSGHRTAP